jgi:hypothetical protein
VVLFKGLYNLGISKLCSPVKVQAVATRLLSSKAQFRSESTPCVICVGKVKIRQVFLRVPLRFHITIIPSVFYIHNSFISTPLYSGPRIAQSVQRLVATGWTVRGIPVWARFSAPVQTGYETHPASCTMGTGSFPGVQRPGSDVDHPPHLAPRLKKE